MKDQLFSKCKKLKTIHYISGRKESFRSQLVIPSTSSSIKKKEFELIENVDELTIPLEITSIEKGSFSNMTEIRKYHGDPKWLSYLSKEKIEEIYIPEGINQLDETVFTDCRNVKEIHIQSTTLHLE